MPNLNQTIPILLAPSRIGTGTNADKGESSSILRITSSPTPTVYQSGALRAQHFLRITQHTLNLHREFEPALLRETLDHILGARPMEYRAGFHDTIGAYVLLALEVRQLSQVSQEKRARCGDPLLEFLSQGGEGKNSLRSDSFPSFFLPATEIQGAA